MNTKTWGDIIRERRGLAFLMLLLTLAIGIAIGTIIQHGASAKTLRDVQQLKISGEGQPLALDNPVSLQEGFSRVAQTVGPAVVNISTKQVIKGSTQRRRSPRGEAPDFFGDDLFDRFFGAIPDMDRVQHGLGSGVIVDSSGYILTNHHVIAKVDKITVKLKDSEEFSARVIGDDPDADLAILKIDAKKTLPFAKVGDADKLKVGDWVLAIGSPFALDQTVTAGIISATHRTIESGGVNPFGDYLQTDAAINPGNSGGPLVNMRGEVVGINSFITSGSGGNLGVGFAIPSTVFVNSYNQLVTRGKMERGWLGVTMNVAPFTPEMAKFFGLSARPDGGYGVLITQLVDEQGKPSKTAGPASKAGIKEEDVIVEFDGKPIKNSFDLRSAVANTPPGKTVQVKVIRFGQTKTFNVKLEERVLRRSDQEESISTDERQELPRDKEIGLQIRDLTPSQAQQLNIEDGGGALIEDVRPGSLADDAGLAANFAIVKANGKPIKSALQLKNLLSGLRSGEPVVLKVVTPPPPGQRDGAPGVFYTSFVKP
ncbi:MAG TPA: trypsin-like peptidase domain-containing protein [Acidobacteriota bacterium]|jgi:serine protease Do